MRPSCPLMPAGALTIGAAPLLVPITKASTTVPLAQLTSFVPAPEGPQRKVPSIPVDVK